MNMQSVACVLQHLARNGLDVRRRTCAAGGPGPCAGPSMLLLVLLLANGFNYCGGSSWPTRSAQQQNDTVQKARNAAHPNFVVLFVDDM